MRSPLAAVAAFVLLAAACTSSTGDTVPPSSTTAPVATIPPSTTSATPDPATTVGSEQPGIAVPPVRSPATRRAIYFVMTDRFANGDPSNDQGGIDGGPLDHGYLPERDGYYHGGDLAGLTARLDYVAGLGAGAVWITPPFTNRTVQGDGTVDGSTAGYHGYWQVDYTQVDPHLGTNDDLRAFVDAAHDRGIAVYLDAVTNHTGDVITYAEGEFAYRSKDAAPYRTAAGEPFDDADLAGSDAFPELDATVSFPYTPAFADPSDAAAKAPAWLNDVTNYHNRGNSTFAGESSQYGDFFGLDDLFTEKPEVVAGMVDVYTDAIDEFGIDGFRVDTAKHVGGDFWAAWVPAIVAHAGRDDFFVFGEVFGESPTFRSEYTTALPFPGLLDWGFNDLVGAYAVGTAGADAVVSHFADDDWYTDADSNASMLVKFIGNHDLGRVGRAIRIAHAGISDADALARMRLAFGLLYATRGIPLVYYGDEQGFVGDGGDRGARQDMFPSRVPSYNDDDLIGTDATTADDNFDTSHPLYVEVAALAALRRDHRALVTGAQVTRPSDGRVLAFSRIDRDERVEYLVVANNLSEPAAATVPTSSPDTTFAPIHGDGATVASGPGGDVDLEVAPLSLIVYRAERQVPASPAAPGIGVTRPSNGATVDLPRFRIQAELDQPSVAEVTFAVAIDGGDFEVLGTDDAPPYSVFWDSTPFPDGTTVEVMATVDDLSGHRAAATSTFTLAPRG